MNKLLFMPLLLVCLPVTFAEESVVQVPFDYHGQSCFLQSETVYQCTWEGEIKPLTVEELEQFAHILTPEQYEEELAKLTAPVVEKVEVVKKSPEEIKLEKLQEKLNKGLATATDATHLRLLKQLDECQRGLGNSAAVQDRSSFVISEFTHGKFNNIEIKGQVGDLLMAIQECQAQNTLEYYVLSDADGNFAKADQMDLGNLDHLAAWKGIQAIDFELYTKNSDRHDLRPICDSHLYADTHKQQMGCEVLYDGKTVGQIKAENEARFGTDGKIQYGSELLGKYHKYLNEHFRYATSEHKKAEAQLAAPILQEMLEENPWYNRE